jgi:hypothetical protein
MVYPESAICGKVRQPAVCIGLETDLFHFNRRLTSQHQYPIDRSITHQSPPYLKYSPYIDLDRCPIAERLFIVAYVQ